MKRNKRAHGRILSVETMQRGSALAVDAAAAATSITVDDAGDFDEDGGWLYIGAQVVEFTACDDDTGVITLATGLTALAEQGDPVHVYDPLYGEVVDYQVALVQLDGEHDNPDPVEAEVAEGVEDLPEGDRGKAGESCTLLRIADDEWELVGIGGRPRRSRGVLFWQDSLTVAATGAQTLTLTHEPVTNSEHLYWNGLYQPGSEWSRASQVVTVPDAGAAILVGDLLTMEYAYRKGVTTANSAPTLDGLPLVGWFSADYEKANQAAGAVTVWSNLATGMGAYDLNGTATLEFTTGPNGGPCLHFTTTQQMALDKTVIATSAGTPAEGYFVRKRDSSAAGSNHNLGSHSTSDLWYPNSGGQVLDDFWSDLLLTFTPTVTLTDWRRYHAWSAANDRGVELDEVSQVSSTAASIPFGPTGSLEVGATGGNAHNGRYGCILLFNRLLTTTERTQVAGYLQAYPSGGMP